MSKLSFQNLCKRYDGAQSLTIKNANIEINKGEFCVFVGPSGCGKSTLLRMVAGLEDISSGDLYIEENRVNDLPPAARGVAMVFQSYALYPHMTVKENLAFGLKVFGANHEDIENRVQRAADILQLKPLLDRLPKALSGGQRQRVAIGRAIVKEPKVFLFDEPLSNLDAALRVQTRLEIAKLHHDLGSASMIYVTHDQVEAMTLADKIVLLHAGDLIEQRGSIAQVGTPMDLYHRPQSLFVAEFIGSPKMNILPATLLDAQQDYATVQVAGQTLKVGVTARQIAAGSKVFLGVRPEHIRTSLQGSIEGLQSIATKVKHVERLGEASLLYVDANAEASSITVRVEGSVKPPAGTELRLGLACEDLHLFDSDGIACRRTVDLPV